MEIWTYGGYWNDEKANQMMLRTPNQIKKLITDLYEGYLKTCRCLTSMRHKNSKLNDEVKKEKKTKKDTLSKTKNLTKDRFFFNIRYRLEGIGKSIYLRFD